MMRRIRNIIMAVAVVLPLCTALGHAQASAAFRVIIASDLHYISPSLTDGGAYYQRVLENGDSKFMPYMEEITSAFFEEVLEARPDALLLTGDLSFNGAVISHQALAEKLRILEANGIPVLVTTGNHDVYNINAAQFQGDGFTRVPFATSESFAQLYAEFGLSEALSVAPDSLSYVYPLIDTVRILVLDLNTAHDDCGISGETLSWVRKQLQEAREQNCFVLAAGHQNLFQHTIFRDGYVVASSEELAALFREFGVPLYLSGHLHIQHIQEEDGVTEIATSALCSYPCQYGILESDGRSLMYHTAQLDMAAWAQRHNRTESVFSRFQNAAADYMTAHFSAAPPIAEEAEREALTAYLQKLNLLYFSGNLRDLGALDPDGALSRKLLSLGDLTALYVSSVLQDSGKNFTLWQTPLWNTPK